MARIKQNIETEISLHIFNKKYELAFEKVYDEYASQIYTYCLRFIGNEADAEDIFQESMIKFLAYIKENNQINNVLGLLFRIAKNTCLNQKRKRHIENIEINEKHLVSDIDSLETKELNQIVHTALNKLPTEQKEAFILQVYQGFSYKEISELLGIPLTNVRNRVVRAKRAVRESVKSYQQEERLIL